MYGRHRSLLMRSSASAVKHNLSVSFKNGQFKAAVVHKSSVHLVGWNSNDSNQTTAQIQSQASSTGAKITILQVKWCHVNGQLLVLVLCRDGLRIYDETGGTMHYWYHLECEGSSGSCLTTTGENCAAAGLTDGAILLFRLGPRPCDAVLLETLRIGHPVAIRDLSTDCDHLASGDDDGRLIIWQSKSPNHKVQTFDGYGFPCTATSLWHNFAIAAYGSGHLRVFDISQGQIIAEVTAHAKWIISLDIAEKTGALMSTSEDSFVRIWQLGTTQDNLISQIFEECIPNRMLCGGCFLDEEGESFATTGFESEEILCYAS